MELPGNLIEYKDKIHSKLSEISLRSLSYSQIVRWILQFEVDEARELAIRIFLNVNYISTSDAKDLCRNLYAKLPPSITAEGQVRFLRMGGEGESGGRLLAEFRKALNLSQELCVDLHDLPELISSSPKLNLVFIDDFVGSGHQAVRSWKERIEPIVAKYEVKLFLLALAGYRLGVEQVKRETPFDVKVGLSLSDADKAFHPSGKLLGLSPWQYDRSRELIRSVGQKLFPKHPLGYEDGQFMLVFYYDTPNNSLPILWSGEAGWFPIFPRSGNSNIDIPAERKIPADDVPITNAFGLKELESLREESQESRSIAPLPQEAPETRIGVPAQLMRPEELIILASTFGAGGSIEERQLLRYASLDRITLHRSLESLKVKNFLTSSTPDFLPIYTLTEAGRLIAAPTLNSGDAVYDEAIRRIAADLLEGAQSFGSNDLERLRFLKDEWVALTRVVEWAIAKGDDTLLIDCRRFLSWFYLQEERLDERLQLGYVSLEVSRRLGDELCTAWIMIDDLGWTLAALGKITEARGHITNALNLAGSNRDRKLFIKSWRHLAGVDIFEKNYRRALTLLMIAYGMARELMSGRESMFASIAKGLGILVLKMGNRPRSIELLRRAHAHYVRDHNEYGRIRIEKHLEAIERNGVSYPTPSPSELRPLKLFLVRHPEATKNAKELFGQRAGDELTPHGRHSMAEIRDLLIKLVPAATNGQTLVLTSDSNSCRDLAEGITEDLGGKLILSNQLLSINTGSLSNLSEEEAEKRYRNSMRQLSFYRAGSWEGYMVFFPEGENVDDFENRVGAELLRILSGEWPVNAAVVVGHRSTITAILNIMYALRRSPDDFLYDYHEVPLMSVFECSIEPIHAQVDVKLHLCASVSGMRGNL